MIYRKITVKITLLKKDLVKNKDDKRSKIHNLTEFNSFSTQKKKAE